MIDKQDAMEFLKSFDYIASEVNHTARQKGFWDYNTISFDTKQTKEYEDLILVSKIGLIVAELAEAIENIREGQTADDKIPAFTGLEAELADAVIRIMDLGSAKKLRVADAIIAKMSYNEERERLHGKRL